MLVLWAVLTLIEVPESMFRRVTLISAVDRHPSISCGCLSCNTNQLCDQALEGSLNHTAVAWLNVKDVVNLNCIQDTAFNA